MDFYSYCTAHAWKHFAGMGIGIRSLMDVYVYASASDNPLNWDYIEAECEKLEMKEYERSARALAEKLFRSSWKTIGTPADDLSDDERKLTEFHLSSGANGTAEYAVIQELRGGSIHEKITFSKGYGIFSAEFFRMRYFVRNFIRFSICIKSCIRSFRFIVPYAGWC